MLWLQKSREKGEDVFEACWQSILFSSSVGLEAGTPVKYFLCVSVRNVADVKVPIQRRFWVGLSLPRTEMAAGCFFPSSLVQQAWLCAAHTASASLCIFELSDVNPHLCRCDLAPFCLCPFWTFLFITIFNVLGANRELPFLDIQLYLDSSGEHLVSRKLFMGKEKHSNCGKVCSSASIKRFAGPEPQPLLVKTVWVCFCFPGTCSRLGIIGLLGTGNQQLIFSGAAR